jgi:hypothetical protein
MTKLWQVPPDMWAAETVAILAAGPSLTQELADSVREHRRIVVNDSYLLALDANILFAHDLAWWKKHPEAHAFAGLMVSGQEGDIDTLYLPMPDEIITLAPWHILQVRNSGLMAIRIAAMAGAARILLCGFQPELEPEKYPGLAAGLTALISELREKGVDVERPTTPLPGVLADDTEARKDFYEDIL